MTTTSNHDTSANYDVNKFANSFNSQDDSNVRLLAFQQKLNKSLVIKRNGAVNSELGSPGEKEKFISLNSNPVNLDPGFESFNRSVEFTNIEKQSLDHPPHDRYRMVFFIFLIHGIGILMPWNMFITAKKYFEDYKLDTPTSHDATYRSEFMFYLGIVSQVSCAVISCVNTFFQFGGQASTRRIAIAIFMMVIIFIFTVILAMVDTSNIPLIFFGLTMASASLLNCCGGVYQNLTFGLAAILPMKYTNAIVLGTVHDSLATGGT